MSQFIFAIPGFSIKGKKFLKEEMGLTGMEVSFNKMPAGGGMLYHHKHQEYEELYFFILGKG